MQVKTVKLNFILNLIRIFLGTTFIVITTPYIARILGPSILGNVEYANSIVAYFILFTVFGIPAYGIREVARTRDNKLELSKTIIELSLIIIVTTIIGYLILFTIIYTNKNLYLIRSILLTMSLNIVFNNFGFEWFYQGIENQIYITKRFIIVRIITIIMMFLFIKTKDNFLIYAFILVMMQSGSNILNMLNLKKYITIKNIKLNKLEIKKHIKPILVIFSATVATAIYLQLDTIMIGNVSKEAVGIYVVPNRLIRMMLVIITALGSVLLPRITNCLKNKDDKSYNMYINYSLNYIFLFSVPMMTACFLLSDEIIYIMAGPQFRESVLTMKILSPILFTIGIAYFLGYQLLYPLGLEKYYTISVIVAAIINFIFNYLMIPKYLQNGAAIGTLIAETIGPLVMIILARKEIMRIDLFSIKRIKYFIASTIMATFIIFLKKYNLNPLEVVIISFFSGGIIYISTLFLLKEDICMQSLKFIKNKIRKV